MGERAIDAIFVVTSFHCGIIQGKSPLAVMFTVRSRPVAGSSSCTYPACSNTTALADVDASRVFTSKSRNFVTCASAVVRVSYDHTFDTPSRSLRE